MENLQETLVLPCKDVFPEAILDHHGNITRNDNRSSALQRFTNKTGGCNLDVVAKKGMSATNHEDPWEYVT
jgi:hypothetical protein